MIAAMKRLTLVGPCNSFSGYGLHLIQIFEDLSRIVPCHVNIRPLSAHEPFGARIPSHVRSHFVSCTQPEDWELLLHPPNFIPTPGKRTAYFTMWESTKLPPPGVNCLNRADVVIVPTEWQRDCFSANGVKSPIYVVPLGIKTEIFRWINPQDLYSTSDENANKVVFGTAGRLAHGGVRKGVNETIKDFLEAFPASDNSVMLKVKVHPDCPVPEFNDSRIEITRAHLSEDDLKYWISGLTCFISEARGEGWGLIQQQSMSVGRPVMCMRFAGLSSFVTESNSFCVPYDLKPAEKNYKDCGSWAVPKPGAFISMMRHVASHPVEARVKGARASEDVSGLSWENSNKKLASVLCEIGAI